jgi:GT2 family glycosyltransferase
MTAPKPAGTSEKLRPGPMLSIAVVSRNTRGLLKACLTRIVDVRIGVPYEVIVVDNGSTDGTATMLGEEFPDVKVREAGENLGFARASNIAFKMARGEFILLLNSDAFVSCGLCEGLLDFMQAHPNAGAVGPRVLNADGSVQSVGFCGFGVFSVALLPILREAVPMMLANVEARRRARLATGTRRVGWLPGCCLLLRKTAVELVGTLREQFFFYGEDVEWCHRARQRGLQVWYVGPLRVVHQGGASGTPPLPEAYWEETVLALHRGTMGKVRAVVANLLILCHVLVAHAMTVLPSRRSRAPGTRKRVRFQLVVLRRLLFHSPCAAPPPGEGIGRGGHPPVCGAGRVGDS